MSARTYTCGQIGCDQTATQALRWPGKEYHSPICGKHAERACSVSLGFVPEFRDIEDLRKENRAADALETARAFFFVGLILEQVESAKAPEDLDQAVAALEECADLVRRVAAFRRGAIL